MPKKDNANTVLIVLLVVAAFAIGVLWQRNSNLEKAAVQPVPTLQATGTQQQDAQKPAQKPEITLEKIKSLFSQDFIAFNSEKGKVLFVEFSDPSCPYCHVASGKNPELNKQIGSRFIMDADGGSYVPPVREMKKMLDSGSASYVYLYRNGHGNGELAAQALYCANEKDAFWSVHDLLMTNSGYTLINEKVRNDKANIPILVQFLGNSVDQSFMTECLTSGKYAEKLLRDTSIGDSFGIGGTPSFFVNTTVFPGAYSFTDMKSIVDQSSS